MGIQLRCPPGNAYPLAQLALALPGMTSQDREEFPARMWFVTSRNETVLHIALHRKLPQKNKKRSLKVAFWALSNDRIWPDSDELAP